MSTYQSKPLALIVAQAFAAGSLIAAAPGVLAQWERIVVTGSSILRTTTEGALPVLTLDRNYIEQSGATTATDLIQSLPQVQNFIANSASVNGNGAGTATASLHALPSKYTLVLIDGVRPPQSAINNSFGGGFAASINGIPLDAVQRVEILLDGATAVYGSDAIAGVVNFILKKNSIEGNAYAQYTWPTKGAANGVEAGVSKGWGDLAKDGWNVMGTFSYNHQDKLQATDRKFSAQGAYFPFTANGVNYIFNNRTDNSEPANITFNAVPAANPSADPIPYSINPYYRRFGNCGTSFAGVILDPTGTGSLGSIGESCRFNYAATVQDLPPQDTLSFVGKGYLKLGDDATAWAAVNLSQFKTVPQYAPPAQPFGLNNTTRTPALYNMYVVPILAANHLVIVSPDPTDPNATLANVGYRGTSLGGRADEYKSKVQQYSAGVDGNAWGWDYNARIVYGELTFTDTAAGGYDDSNGFFGAINAGLYDPIAGTGGASVRPFILNSLFSKTYSKQNNLHAGAQHDFFQLPGGPTTLALGIDFYQQKYKVNYGDYYLFGSGFATEPPGGSFPIGGNYGQVPLGMSRDNWAMYGEWLFPIFKTVEASASVRYDHYDKTHSNWVFDPINVDPVTGLHPQLPDADLGNTFSKTTYKVTARWVPVQDVLVRGSYGTGFRAPAMTDIAGTLVFSGSTQNSYSCPFPGSAGCLPGSAQYDLLAGPNGASGELGLKPETSKQWTAGGRWDVMGFSLGADLWNVKIKNQVLSQGVAEQLGFENSQRYSYLFTNPYADPAGFTTIAFSQLPFNGGTAKYRGIDWDVTYRTDTRWGAFSANWTGTRMLKAEYTLAPDEPFNTDLGQYGPDQQVVFKTTMQLILSLQTGAWTNALTAHYKSGYKDAGYGAGEAIFLASPDGSLGDSVAFCCLHVPSYTTWDWQTVYNFSKDIRATIGITNMFDRDPPRSLQSGGGGNQIGYDGRYANPIGRAIYGRVGVKF